MKKQGSASSEKNKKKGLTKNKPFDIIKSESEEKEMNDYEKIHRLIEIMYEEDEERYNNNKELIYHTKEEFEEEYQEKNKNRS